MSNKRKPLWSGMDVVRGDIVATVYHEDPPLETMHACEECGEPTGRNCPCGCEEVNNG